MSQRFNSFALVLAIVAIIAAVVFMFLAPKIPQWPSYHQFADKRSLWGIANFADVLSNVLFLFIGCYGLVILMRNSQQNGCDSESLVYTLLFASIILVCFGSAYYHLAPDNATLVWDRIPMTLVFMTALSLTIMQRINHNLGLYLLVPLLIFGVFSVIYWYCSELSGAGDLRLYALVQFYSMLIIVAILMFFPKHHPPTKAYIWLGVWYFIAKLAEHFDRLIFTLTGVVSGHTLKHLAAAIACFGFVMMIKSIKANEIRDKQ